MSDFKAKIYQIDFSFQRAPTPPSWIYGDLLLRVGEGRGADVQFFP